MTSPQTTESFVDFVKSDTPCRILGTGTKQTFGKQVTATNEVSTRLFTGIVDWFHEDFVVTVRSGTQISELQSELRTKGQCLPILSHSNDLEYILAGMPGTVGGLSATNLPTAIEYAFKNPRYWILGMTVLKGDGEIIKCGCRTVKNVAGYDIHKLNVGAFGTLGIILEVTLRVFPDSILDTPTRTLGKLNHVKQDVFFARESQTFQSANGIKCMESGIVWSNEPMTKSVGPGQFLVDKENLDMLLKIKHVFDPSGIFNPGIAGDF